MLEFTEEEVGHIDEPVDAPASVALAGPEEAAGPRCLFCRYRVPAVTEDLSHA